MSERREAAMNDGSAQAAMRRSYLIQRLEKPWSGEGHPLMGQGNPFTFGGGYKNGGLSSEAMDLLRPIFRFDYMGSAEFEFGAVPEALSRIAQQREHLRAWPLTIQLREVAKDFRDDSTDEPDGEATVYVICHEDWVAEVRKRVRSFAANGYRTGTKEAVHLSAVLRPAPNGGWTPNTCGWLELDNGYFFFTDRQMWESTAALFGVPIAAIEPAENGSEGGAA